MAANKKASKEQQRLSVFQPAFRWGASGSGGSTIPASGSSNSSTKMLKKDEELELARNARARPGRSDITKTETVEPKRNNDLTTDSAAVMAGEETKRPATFQPIFKSLFSSKPSPYDKSPPPNQSAIAPRPLLDETPPQQPPRGGPRGNNTTRSVSEAPEAKTSRDAKRMTTFQPMFGSFFTPKPKDKSSEPNHATQTQRAPVSSLSARQSPARATDLYAAPTNASGSSKERRSGPVKPKAGLQNDPRRGDFSRNAIFPGRTDAPGGLASVPEDRSTMHSPLQRNPAYSPPEDEETPLGISNAFGRGGGNSKGRTILVSDAPANSVQTRPGPNSRVHREGSSSDSNTTFTRANARGDPQLQSQKITSVNKAYKSAGARERLGNGFQAEDLGPAKQLRLNEHAPSQRKPIESSAGVQMTTKSQRPLKVNSIMIQKPASKAPAAPMQDVPLLIVTDTSDISNGNALNQQGEQYNGRQVLNETTPQKVPTRQILPRRANESTAGSSRVSPLPSSAAEMAGPLRSRSPLKTHIAVETSSANAQATHDVSAASSHEENTRGSAIHDRTKQVVLEEGSFRPGRSALNLAPMQQPPNEQTALLHERGTSNSKSWNPLRTVLGCEKQSDEVEQVRRLDSDQRLMHIDFPQPRTLSNSGGGNPRGAASLSRVLPPNDYQKSSAMKRVPSGTAEASSEKSKFPTSAAASFTRTATGVAKALQQPVDTISPCATVEQQEKVQVAIASPSFNPVRHSAVGRQHQLVEDASPTQSPRQVLGKSSVSPPMLEKLGRAHLQDASLSLAATQEKIKPVHMLRSANTITSPSSLSQPGRNSELSSVLHTKSMEVKGSRSDRPAGLLETPPISSKQEFIKSNVTQDFPADQPTFFPASLRAEKGSKTRRLAQEGGFEMAENTMLQPLRSRFNGVGKQTSSQTSLLDPKTTSIAATAPHTAQSHTTDGIVQQTVPADVGKLPTEQILTAGTTSSDNNMHVTKMATPRDFPLPPSFNGIEAPQPSPLFSRGFKTEPKGLAALPLRDRKPVEGPQIATCNGQGSPGIMPVTADLSVKLGNNFPVAATKTVPTLCAMDTIVRPAEAENLKHVRSDKTSSPSTMDKKSSFCPSQFEQIERPQGQVPETYPTLVSTDRLVPETGNQNKERGQLDSDDGGKLSSGEIQGPPEKPVMKSVTMSNTVPPQEVGAISSRPPAAQEVADPKSFAARSADPAPRSALPGRWTGKAKEEKSPERADGVLVAETSMSATTTDAVVTELNCKELKSHPQIEPETEMVGHSVQFIKPSRDFVDVPSEVFTKSDSTTHAGAAFDQKASLMIIPGDLAISELVSPHRISRHSGNGESVSNDIPSSTPNGSSPQPSEEDFCKQMRQSVMFQTAEPAEKFDPLSEATDVKMKRKSRKNRSISISGLQPPPRESDVPSMPSMIDSHDARNRDGAASAELPPILGLQRAGEEHLTLSDAHNTFSSRQFPALSMTTAEEARHIPRSTAPAQTIMEVEIVERVRSPPRNVQHGSISLIGDTHLHTSFDIYTASTASSTPGPLGIRPNNDHQPAGTIERPQAHNPLSPRDETSFNPVDEPTSSAGTKQQSESDASTNTTLYVTGKEPQFTCLLESEIQGERKQGSFPKAASFRGTPVVRTSTNTTAQEVQYNSVKGAEQAPAGIAPSNAKSCHRSSSDSLVICCEKLANSRSPCQTLVKSKMVDVFDGLLQSKDTERSTLALSNMTSGEDDFKQRDIHGRAEAGSPVALVGTCDRSIAVASSSSEEDIENIEAKTARISERTSRFEPVLGSLFSSSTKDREISASPPSDAFVDRDVQAPLSTPVVVTESRTSEVNSSMPDAIIAHAIVEGKDSPSPVVRTGLIDGEKDDRASLGDDRLLILEPRELRDFSSADPPSESSGARTDFLAPALEHGGKPRNDGSNVIKATTLNDPAVIETHMHTAHGVSRSLNAAPSAAPQELDGDTHPVVGHVARQNDKTAFELQATLSRSSGGDPSPVVNAYELDGSGETISPKTAAENLTDQEKRVIGMLSSPTEKVRQSFFIAGPVPNFYEWEARERKSSQDEDEMGPFESPRTASKLSHAFPPLQSRTANARRSLSLQPLPSQGQVHSGGQRKGSAAAHETNAATSALSDLVADYSSTKVGSSGQRLNDMLESPGKTVTSDVVGNDSLANAPGDHQLPYSALPELNSRLFAALSPEMIDAQRPVDQNLLEANEEQFDALSPEMIDSHQPGGSILLEVNDRQFAALPPKVIDARGSGMFDSNSQSETMTNDRRMSIRSLVNSPSWGMANTDTHEPCLAGLPCTDARAESFSPGSDIRPDPPRSSQDFTPRPVGGAASSPAPALPSSLLLSSQLHESVHSSHDIRSSQCSSPSTLPRHSGDFLWNGYEETQSQLLSLGHDAGDQYNGLQESSLEPETLRAHSLTHSLADQEPQPSVPWYDVEESLNSGNSRGKASSPNLSRQFMPGGTQSSTAGYNGAHLPSRPEDSMREVTIPATPNVVNDYSTNVTSTPRGFGPLPRYSPGRGDFDKQWGTQPQEPAKLNDSSVSPSEVFKSTPTTRSTDGAWATGDDHSLMRPETSAYEPDVSFPPGTSVGPDHEIWGDDNDQLGTDYMSSSMNDVPLRAIPQAGYESVAPDSPVQSAWDNISFQAKAHSPVQGSEYRNDDGPSFASGNRVQEQCGNHSLQSELYSSVQSYSPVQTESSSPAQTRGYSPVLNKEYSDNDISIPDGHEPDCNMPSYFGEDTVLYSNFNFRPTHDFPGDFNDAVVDEFHADHSQYTPPAYEHLESHGYPADNAELNLSDLNSDLEWDHPPADDDQNGVGSFDDCESQGLTTEEFQGCPRTVNGSRGGSAVVDLSTASNENFGDDDWEASPGSSTNFASGGRYSSEDPLSVGDNYQGSPRTFSDSSPSFACSRRGSTSSGYQGDRAGFDDYGAETPAFDAISRLPSPAFNGTGSGITAANYHDDVSGFENFGGGNLPVDDYQGSPRPFQSPVMDNYSERNASCDGGFGHILDPGYVADGFPSSPGSFGGGAVDNYPTNDYQSTGMGDIDSPQGDVPPADNYQGSPRSFDGAEMDSYPVQAFSDYGDFAEGASPESVADGSTGAYGDAEPSLGTDNPGYAADAFPHSPSADGDVESNFGAVSAGYVSNAYSGSPCDYGDAQDFGDGGLGCVEDDYSGSVGSHEGFGESPDYAGEASPVNYDSSPSYAADGMPDAYDEAPHSSYASDGNMDLEIAPTEPSWDGDELYGDGGFDDAGNYPASDGEDMSMVGEADDYYFGNDGGDEQLPTSPMDGAESPIGDEGELSVDEVHGGGERSMSPMRDVELSPGMEAEGFDAMEGSVASPTEGGEFSEMGGEGFSPQPADEEYNLEVDGGSCTDDLSLPLDDATISPTEDSMMSDGDEEVVSSYGDASNDGLASDVSTGEPEIAASFVDEDIAPPSPSINDIYAEDAEEARELQGMDDLYEDDVVSVPVSPISTDHDRETPSPFPVIDQSDHWEEDEDAIFGEPVLHPDPANSDPVRLSCLYKQDIGLLSSSPPTTTLPQEIHDAAETNLANEDEELLRDPVRFSALYRQSLHWDQAVDLAAWEEEDDDSDRLSEVCEDESSTDDAGMQAVRDPAWSGSPKDLPRLEADHEHTVMAAAASSCLSPRPPSTPPPDSPDNNNDSNVSGMDQSKSVLSAINDNFEPHTHLFSPRLQAAPLPRQGHSSNLSNLDMEDPKGPQTFDEMGLSTRAMSPPTVETLEEVPEPSSSSTSTSSRKSLSQRVSGWWAGAAGLPGTQLRERPPPLPPAPYDSRYGEPCSPL